MPASAQDFKARVRKIVTLPFSRLEVEIKIIDCMVFLGLGELPIPTDDAPSNGGTTTIPDMKERMTMELQYADRAILMGAVSPRFSDQPGDASNLEIVSIPTDLTYADRLFLGNAICEWSGLSARWAAAVDAFRADTEREARASVSAGVSQVTE